MSTAAVGPARIRSGVVVGATVVALLGRVDEPITASLPPTARATSPVVACLTADQNRVTPMSPATVGPARIRSGVVVGAAVVALLGRVDEPITASLCARARAPRRLVAGPAGLDGAAVVAAVTRGRVS